MHRSYRLGLLALTLCTLNAEPPLPRKSTRQQWKLADFTWVKHSRREAGSPENAHPAKVEAERLRQVLSSIQLENPKGNLFASEEIGYLVAPIQEALALAEANEDLVLLSTHRRGGNFLNTPYGLTARIFVQEGRLNLIVHDARLDFMDQYRTTNIPPTFVYGSRTAVGNPALSAPEAKQHRKDWLSFSLESTPKVTAPEVATPAPKPRPYQEQEERLRGLKRLREENLITEEEYQKKREEVLRNL